MWVQDRLFDLPPWERWDIEPCVWPNCDKDWILLRSYLPEPDLVHTWITGIHTDGSEKHTWQDEHDAKYAHLPKPSRRWWEFWKE